MIGNILSLPSRRNRLTGDRVISRHNRTLRTVFPAAQRPFAISTETTAPHRPRIIGQGRPSDLIEQIIKPSHQPAGWLALNGDKNIHFTHDYQGFVMYSARNYNHIALGDPVGPDQNLGAMIDDFVAFSRQRRMRPVFYQIDAEHKSLYQDRGFRLFKLGEEAHIPLGDFTMKGKNYLKLRYNHGKAKRDGLRFEIASGAALAPLIPAMRQISDIWLAGKKKAEKGFSLGQFDPDFLGHNPCALVWLEDRLVAFASLLVTDSKHEMLVDLMRYCPNTPHGTMDFLFIETCLWAREQGFGRLNIGLAPLSGLDHDAGDPLWGKIGQIIRTRCNHFYNFAGVREFKHKFRPVWHPKYLAVPKGCNPYATILDIALGISGGWRGLLNTPSDAYIRRNNQAAAQPEQAANTIAATP